jgi:hypothetical protein
LVLQDQGRTWAWTDEYVVLGDDIVIFSGTLADKYYWLVNTYFGVNIGLAKSVRSRSRLCLEFAKKYWVDGKRAFVLPIRDILVSCISTAVASEFITKHDITLNHYLLMRGLGYKARGAVNSRL